MKHTPKTRFEPSSYRDPDGSVFYQDQKVYRSLKNKSSTLMEKLLSQQFFQNYVKQGKVIGTKLIKGSKTNFFPTDYVLEHQNIDIFTYPYEWSFSMLRDGALLTLELLQDCLRHGFILKDGSAWNITYHKGQMCFIDVLSIGEYEPGQLWEGYSQFCREFLYPLMLKAHKDINFQDLFRATLKGIDPHLMSALFTKKDLFKSGVFKHLYINEKLSNRKSIKSDTIKGKVNLPKASLLHLVENLIKVVRSLKNKSDHSVWVNYTKTNTYSDSDEREKSSFVRDYVSSLAKKRYIVDIGCNTGNYSLIAAETHQVLSCDIDPDCIDMLYQKNLKNKVSNIIPVVQNLVNPSPCLGWQLKERKSFFNRVQVDGFLSLALIHHVCISENVPLLSFVECLRSIAPSGVLEWVSKEDPMVQFLLRNRKDVFSDYNWEGFESCVTKHFKIEKTVTTNNGTRTLCWLKN